MIQDQNGHVEQVLNRIFSDSFYALQLVSMKIDNGYGCAVNFVYQLESLCVLIENLFLLIISGSVECHTGAFSNGHSILPGKIIEARTRGIQYDIIL